MPSKEVEIVNRLGMHLRAAASFVRIAEGFPCTVKVSNRGQHAEGKSILSLLALGVPQGERIKIEAKGARDAECLEALVKFVAERFGEDD